MNPDVDGYTKTHKHRKILRKTQKIKKLLKTTRILKPKYKLNCDSFFTISLPEVGVGAIWASALHQLCHWSGAELGRCQGGTAPPKFCLAPPVAPPKIFRSLSESPTQTIDSSPCCKTGPSSGPPKWKCLAPPLPLVKSAYGEWLEKIIFSREYRVAKEPLALGNNSSQDPRFLQTLTLPLKTS